MKRETEALMDDLLDQLADKVWELRERYPLADYAGRVYHCSRCASVDGCAAPRDELVDDYPCTNCGGPQVPWTDPGVPLYAP
jgi:hypothetical protein